MCVFCCSEERETKKTPTITTNHHESPQILPILITTNHHTEESSPRSRSEGHRSNHRGRFEPRASVGSTATVSTEASLEEDCCSAKDSRYRAWAESPEPPPGVLLVFLML